jgi:hypothetical protein
MSEVLRAALPRAIGHVIDQVTLQVPAYRVNETDPIAAVLQTGVRVALERLLDLLGTDQPALGPAQRVYDGIGVGEFRSGRALESVLAAYRVGATATWQTFSDAAVEADFDPATIADLAQACFAYIDEIASASAAGYARAQSRDAGQREIRTRTLVERILAGQADSPTTREIAAEIGWTQPDRLRVVVLSGRVVAPPGGVATGIMNAHDADRVAGIISSRGFARMATATDARIGRIISVVAVFDVSSVRKVRPQLTSAIIM